MTEAALVLDPGRFDLHRDAVNLLNWIYFQKLRDQPQRRTDNPADWPEERLAREMLPTGLYHEEAYLLNTCVKGQDSWTFPASADYLFRTLEFRPDRESFESYLKEHQEEIESIQAMCKRVMEAKQRGNVQDESPVLLFSFYERPMPKKGNGFKIDDWCRKYVEEHLQEICDARLRFLEDFSYLKTRAWAPVVELHITFRPSDTAAEEPIYAAFLKKVQSMPNRESKAFADNILDFNAMRARAVAEAQLAAAQAANKPQPKDNAIHYSNGVAVPIPPSPPEGAEPEVAFHPLTLHSMLKCQPLVDGIDMFVDHGNVYLMKTKGELRHLRVEMVAVGDRATNVCFDGRYVWIASPDTSAPQTLGVPAQPADDSTRFLAVIDPHSEAIWKFTAADGLPPLGLNRGAAVAPFAPGRICVAGYFGREWCGVASFDPVRGKSFQVIYEAHEVVAGADGPDRDPANAPPVDSPEAAEFAKFRLNTQGNARRATPIECVFAMTGADGPGKPDVHRILLGGGSRILVLDGKTGQPLKIIPIQDVANHVFAGPAGTIYWIGLPNAPNRSPVYAASFPDFSGRLVRPSSVGIYPRASLFQADRIVQFEPCARDHLGRAEHRPRVSTLAGPLDRIWRWRPLWSANRDPGRKPPLRHPRDGRQDLSGGVPESKNPVDLRGEVKVRFIVRAVSNESIPTSPKRKRGTWLASSHARRAGINFNRSKYNTPPGDEKHEIHKHAVDPVRIGAVCR